MWLIESLLAMTVINQHQQEKKSVNVTINGNFLGKVGKNDTQVDCKRVVVVSENWEK
jgi:acyl-coenzyme A thioesterase PaaI-like protein